jgi:hypothetical protein
VIQVVDTQKGLANSVNYKLPNGGDYVRSVFIGTQEKPKTVERDKPTLYMVQQMPRTVVDAHYHVVAQWQVIVDGSGMLGRNAAKPVALHYADPYTGYGPITAGDEGVTYYTIRSMADPGAQYLTSPEAKAKLVAMRPAKRRYLYITADETKASTSRDLAIRTDTSVGTLVPPHDDGVAAWIVRMRPSGELAAPGGQNAGGQAMLVVGGALIHERAELRRMSCAFIPSGEGPMHLQASNEGAEVLLLQFPSVHSS